MASNVKRPLYARVWFWGVVVLVLLLAVVVTWAALLAPRVLTARAALTEAIPLANQAKQQVFNGEGEAAEQTIARLAELSAEAREQSDSVIWAGLEWAPVAGPNLAAVRVASTAVDELVTEVVKPLAGIDVSAIKQPGGVNLDALQQVTEAVIAATGVVDQISSDIDGIEREGLVSQVQDGVDKLDGAVAELRAVLDPASDALQVVPGVLGADGPRSYLLIFQNNAEARGTGGNPAAMMRISFTDGRISVEEQASSADFVNGRPDPIVELDEPTRVLFDTKIARYIPDITLTPDFTETARIAQAYWAESFGTPVDGVISFDPVALSYLLEATGPIHVPTGETVSADNAVSLLLNEVYGIYPRGPEQDEFFASVAGLTFEVLVSGEADMRDLLDPLARSLEEGRLMFSPNDPAIAELIAGTRVAGMLPTDNAESTAVGVLINDTTVGKMNYYMQLDLTATSSQCVAPTSPEFEVNAAITNTLDKSLAEGLPSYISPASYISKGDIRSDVVFYGPVGGTFVSAEVNGASWKAELLRSIDHLGRPAVRVIDIYNAPEETKIVTVRFAGAEGELGPLEIRSTPLVRPTTTSVETAGCGD